MDVGPTRSMGFTPTAIERITPTDAPVRDALRPTADGAASEATTGTAPDDETTQAQPLDELRRSEAARLVSSGSESSAYPAPPLTKAERNMQRLMDKVAGPLRSYLEEGPLTDDDKKAFVEALTQFEADVGRLSETIDVADLNKEMRATFERFYVALIRIFGTDEESVGDGMPRTARPSSATADRSSSASILGASEGDAPQSRRGGSSPTIRESQSAANDADEAIPSAGDYVYEAPSNADPVDESYRRIASMYTALYGLSEDQSSLLNERG